MPPPRKPRWLRVEPGEEWHVGRHWFACGDVVGGAELSRLTSGPQIDLVYSDPPWIDGQAKLYFNQSGRDAGELHPALAILAAVVGPARERGLLAYVEVGLPTLDTFVTALAGLGAKLTGVWDDVYCYRRRIGLLAADFRPQPVEDHPDFGGLDDAETPLVAMQRRGLRGVVLDPCCGLGKTSRAAVLAGWSSLNHDLVPDRVARAAEAVSDMTGARPVVAALPAQ